LFVVQMHGAILLLPALAAWLVKPKAACGGQSSGALQVLYSVISSRANR
jgi:hypothetical protein